jgi:hypothetical protein
MFSFNTITAFVSLSRAAQNMSLSTKGLPELPRDGTGRAELSISGRRFRTLRARNNSEGELQIPGGAGVRNRDA